MERDKSEMRVKWVKHKEPKEGEGMRHSELREGDGEACVGGGARVRSYLPTPPLGQDMTQGQFLSGV